MDKFIAIIPARGGSERMEDKATRPFAGKSLLEWTIIQAKYSKYIDHIFVVTDSEQIINIANSFYYITGTPVQPIDQLTRYCQYGRIGGSIAVAQTIQSINDLGMDYDHFLVLFPTSPLRKPNDIDDAITMYSDLGLNHLASKGPIDKLIPHYDLGDRKSISASPYRLFGFLSYSEVVSIISKEYYMKNNFPDGIIDIDEHIRKCLNNLENEQNSPPRIIIPERYYPVERWQICDIDYIDEFVAAEAVFKLMIIGGRSEEIYKEYYFKSKRNSR